MSQAEEGAPIHTHPGGQGPNELSMTQGGEVPMDPGQRRSPYSLLIQETTACPSGPLFWPEKVPLLPTY